VKVLVPAFVADQSWAAIVIVSILALIGGITLYSVAGGSLSPWATSHALRFLLYLMLALVLSYVPPAIFGKFAYLALAGGIALLVVVMATGVIAGGARSWLNLGFMQIQPSELVKIALVGVLAHFFANVPPREFNSLRIILPPLLFTIVPFLLIAAQPDLGTAMLLLLTAVIVCFLAGLPLKWFATAAAAVVVIVPLSYNFLLPHQQRRLTIFLNPEDDPLGGGYHITQSSIAIGSGGITGKGYLQGSQSHLQYLPEAHTDFVVPAIVEEWGIVGGIVIIVLFGALIRWGMKVARKASGRFEQLLGAGLICSLFLYIAINLMMVTGMAPVVGIPLPLVSYGGSAMLAAMISVGLLMSIDRANRAAARPSRFT
jgi:rod shape determining protein RodA